MLRKDDTRIIVSTVGAWRPLADKEVNEIGHNRHYETMAFHATRIGLYWDADVTTPVAFDSDWAIEGITESSDSDANAMHEKVVEEISQTMDTSTNTAVEKLTVYHALIGATLRHVECHEGGERVVLRTSAGDEWEWYHETDCCEQVQIAEVIGIVADLIGSPICRAEEIVHKQNVTPEGANGTLTYGEDSFTWTFYRFGTVEGEVVVRWRGISNGYYSETVSLRVNGEDA